MGQMVVVASCYRQVSGEGQMVVVASWYGQVSGQELVVTGRWLLSSAC